MIPQAGPPIAHHPVGDYHCLASSAARLQDLNYAGAIAELHDDRLKAITLYQRASQTMTSQAEELAIEKNASSSGKREVRLC